MAKPAKITGVTFACDHCNKSFVKEGSLQTHMCEKKRRFLAKNDKEVVAGYTTYNYWYLIAMGCKKEKTYIEFINSKQYIGFVKFGKYIIDSKVSDWNAYVKWLIDNKIRLDEWCKDSIFSRFYTNLNKIETPERALEKYIMVADDWSHKTGNHWSEFWQKANPFMVIDYVNQGKISPWILFSSQHAQHFIDTLPNELLPSLVKDIDIEFWKKKTTKNKEDSEWINQVLQ